MIALQLLRVSEHSQGKLLQGEAQAGPVGWWAHWLLVMRAEVTNGLLCTCRGGCPGHDDSAAAVRSGCAPGRASMSGMLVGLPTVRPAYGLQGAGCGCMQCAGVLHKLGRPLTQAA